MKYKVTVYITLIFSFAFILQIFATISVPIVHSIALSEYDGYRFGVFGWCYVKTNNCTGLCIGYPGIYSLLSPEYQGLSLPSHAKSSVTKLLIVHPLALLSAFILWFLSILINWNVIGELQYALLFGVILSGVTFLLAVLSFLVDILLFTPYLKWPGWVLFASAILVAIGSSMLCSYQRIVSLKKVSKIGSRPDIELSLLNIQEECIEPESEIESITPKTTISKLEHQSLDVVYFPR